MKILVIGSGGREHALVWKIRQSPFVTKIYCAPGNAGIANVAEIVPIDVNEIDQLSQFAVTNQIDLTVVGPEQPLSRGIVDEFERNNLKIFGPRKSAAILESSKAFAKEFMSRKNIPTANFKIFTKENKFDAERYINDIPVPIVIKVDGLAAGKGVEICETKDQALNVLDEIFIKNKFGNAGDRVIIEDYLIGEELSLLTITDGENYVIFPPARDYKRIFDGDQGKNTGGMGAYAPVPFVDGELLYQIEQTIIRPTILGMKQEGKPFVGCLYFGLMLTETGPYVVEYNCRFGDPETQVVLPLIGNDLIEIMTAAIENKLNNIKLILKDAAAICVVLSSRGYPDSYEMGKEILGFDKITDDVMVFHAGTKLQEDKVITAGGRVLSVTGFGPKAEFKKTISRVYRAVEQITFDGAYYRSDIGKNINFQTNGGIG